MKKKYFDTISSLFLVLLFLLSIQLLSIGQVKGELISSSFSIDDNVDPLDGLKSSALFSNVSVMVDAGPIDVKNLTVSLKDEFFVEGDLVDVHGISFFVNGFNFSCLTANSR